jgi:hypothetical protein
VLISRHPLEAAQQWIDANEKELVERKISGVPKDRIGQIPLCGIGPMKRPNLYIKLLVKLKIIRPARTPKYKFGKPRTYEYI